MTGEQISIVPGAWTNQAADYSVSVLTVSVGTTITWTNDDPGMIHTVTSVDGTFDSGFLNEGDT